MSASLYLPPSLPVALDALAERGPDGAVLAGGTWIMRGPIRHEPMARAYVAVSHLPSLQQVMVTDAAVEIGAGVTHAALAAALAGHQELAALAQAAGLSANPAVRAVATVGGNLCATAFAAADLVPALLSLDAQVELAGHAGIERMALARFLAIRAALEPGRLLTRIVVPRRPARSAHVRLTLRKAGDYPVAIVSLAAELDAAGRVRAARVAVGSVEAVARRWDELEAALIGRPLDPGHAATAAAALGDGFTARDGVEAPGWYRLQVLPTLVRRAVAAVTA